jgi:flagellar hook protein FlgE
VKEIWKDIDGYEGLFVVSDQARVKSMTRRVNRGGGTTRSVPEKIMAQFVNEKGYIIVHLSINRVVKTVKLSRLVATAFVANPLNMPEVNHDDGNKSNNLPSNLSWTNRSGNLKHAYRTGLRPSPVGWTRENGHV